MCTGRSIVGLVTIVSLGLAAPAGAADPASLGVAVDAGEHERRNTPVCLALPAPWARAEHVRLVRIDNGEVIPAQLLKTTPPRIAWIVRNLAAGASRRYRLEPTSEPPVSARVTVADDGRSLTVRVHERPALRYNHAEIASPPGIDPIYRRSGQIHPLFAPSGALLTDDFPPDHAHQHALFFAWVNTTFHEHHVDFWNQKEQTGRVRHTAIVAQGSGPVLGGFTVRLRHEDVSNPDTPVGVLDEEWDVQVHDRTDVFVADLMSRQTCIAAQPLQINKYHYGGFGLRGNRAWFDPSAQGNAPPDPAQSGRSDFLTSQGKHHADGNHTRPRWVDLSGEVAGRFCGVAVLDHPENFGFPQPVRLHPNKPYFCFAPCVLGPFTLEPGKPYVSRYRLILHDGPPDPKLLAELWADYSEPPRVRVVAE